MIIKITLGTVSKFTLCLLFCSSVFTDVKSTSGQIRFQTQSNNSSEMILNTTGLGIGVTPSYNLHVNGNSMVSNQIVIGGSNGSSNLFVNGTMSYGIQTVSANTTLENSSLILADSSSDNITITLPYAGNVRGRQYQLKKISKSNSVWISGGGNVIDDTGVIEMNELDPLGSVKLISNGSQWYKIEQKNISNTVASDNLIGWWKMDETSGSISNDSSEKNNHGTLNNISSENIGVAGKVLNSIDFDGSDDYINQSVNAGDSLDLSNQITISAWVNFDNITNRTILEKSVGGAVNSQYLLFVNSSVFKFRLVKSGNRDLLSDVTVVANQWYHVVATYDGSEMRMYVDGLLQSGTTSVAAPINSGTGEFRIGRLINDGFNMNGRLDDVRIYDRHLSSAEIHALYNQGG